MIRIYKFWILDNILSRSSYIHMSVRRSVCLKQDSIREEPLREAKSSHSICLMLVLVLKISKIKS